MKKIILAAVCCIALAGCGSIPSVTPQQANNAAGQVVATVKTVQSYTQQVCKFVPTAATLISLFNSGAGGTVSAISDAICNAVSTNPLAEGDVPGYYKAARVNGVVIKGKFVK